MVTLILLLGLVNWFGTLLIVESEFFRPLRVWIVNRATNAERRFGVWWWGKVNYMINCHMCAGTWVGLALVPFAPSIFPYIVTALLIKAFGHLFLVAHKFIESLTDESKTRRQNQVRNWRVKGGE